MFHIVYLFPLKFHSNNNVKVNVKVKDKLTNVLHRKSFYYERPIHLLHFLSI